MKKLEKITKGNFLIPLTGESGVTTLDTLGEVIDVNHPGFKDSDYVFRRNQIAEVARSYNRGSEVPEVEYDSKEHKLWSFIYWNLENLYPRWACKEFRKSFLEFDLQKSKIPQFKNINKKLSRVGFRISPVEGLVSPREFLVSLADSDMMCTQYIRHFSVPDYTPEPDIIHEIFGHAVFFFNEEIREINKLFGLVSKKTSEDQIERLMRLYWYTIEFGVCLQDEKPKAYGAGLLSSMRELESLEEIELKPFCLETMMQTPYDTMDTQPFLFCAPSFSEAIDSLREHLNSQI